jgi:mannose/fructose/N-acetylgalactosamine-specific phosphotransferase system component IID
MRAATISLLRLLGVQSGWTYERMGGIGVAFAMAPLLEEGVPADRRTGAFIRSAEFFNSHPWLAGLAVGAEARAERDGVPAEQIQRLRAALGGPLGALGDRVIWAGLLPVLSAIALVGGGLWGWALPVLAVVLAGALRWEVTRWSLKRGLESGMRVATVLKDCTLSRISTSAGITAAAATGLAATFVARGALARVAPVVEPWMVLAAGAVGLLVVLKAGARLPAYRLALVAGGLALLLSQVIRP